LQTSEGKVALIVHFFIFQPQLHMPCGSSVACYLCFYSPDGCNKKIISLLTYQCVHPVSKGTLSFIVI